MTRFRHATLTEGATLVTHCTIDSGPDTVQTAVTFRVTDTQCDLLVVRRPTPNKVQADNDSGNFTKLA